MDTQTLLQHIANAKTTYYLIKRIIIAIQKTASEEIAEEINLHLVACEYSKNSQMIAVALIAKEGALEDILRIFHKDLLTDAEKLLLEYASSKSATKNELEENTAKRLFNGCHCLNGHQIIHE